MNWIKSVETMIIKGIRSPIRKGWKNIFKEIRNRLANHAEIEINSLREMPKLPSGKFPFIIPRPEETSDFWHVERMYSQD